MSVKAKIIIDEKEINVLSFNFGFNQSADTNGRPSQKPVFAGLQLVIETRKDLNLADWSFTANQTKQLELHIYPVIMGGKTRKLYFYDCHLIHWNNHFSSMGNQPMSETLQISAAGVKDSNSSSEYSAYWRETFKEDTIVPTVLEESAPNITNINWIHPETKEHIKETTYTESVALTAQIENQDSDSATITITKEDGTEFENGEKELTFEEAINDDGTIELSSLEIKEQWQDFKTTDVNKLVAKLSHSGINRKSKPLQIVPPPKVIVDFRPSKNYSGEYGFDYMRHQIDKNDKLTYKDILGTNYEYDKTKKKWIEKFKKYTTDTKYNDLKDTHYKTITFPWHKDSAGKEIEYIQSWLTIYPKETQTLSLQIETIENPKNLNLSFEYDKTLFKLNTDTIPGQNKGKKRLKDHLTIECLKAFNTDETIKVLYKKQQLGQLNLLANAKNKRKKLEVVFVEVETELVIGTPKTGSATGKKAFLIKYLQQAFIKPAIVVESLDLKTDKTFNKKFDPKTKGYIGNRTGLHDYLNTKLDKKYKNYLKVYFIGDKCPGSFSKTGRIMSTVSGQAKGINSDAVVLFQGHNTSTTAHEALHALGLYHTFSPNRNHPYSYKKGATYNIMDYSHQPSYGSKNRIITWLWQWKKLWNNPLVKPE